MSARFPDAYAEAKLHARECYPEESCGFVVADRYIRLQNAALSPDEHVDVADCGCRLCSFVIAGASYLEHEAALQMILHSHPGGPLFPSRRDMIGQMNSNVPWGIISLDEDRIGDPLVWGGDTPMEPIIGRQFMHGITDCYTLIRDTYALGKDALAEQEITGWPLDPIQIPEVPRDDSWWSGDYDLYEIDGFKAGFREITRDQVRAGDGFLMKVRSEKFNHGGLVLSTDLILHHLPGRLSRREPSGIWSRQVGKWLRYMGPEE